MYVVIHDLSYVKNIKSLPSIFVVVYDVGILVGIVITCFCILFL
jgi:hypothetical protein